MTTSIRVYSCSFVVGILMLLTSSCAMFAPNDRDGLNSNLPEQFTLYSADGVDATNRWWESFQSLELNGLVDEALTNSPSIQQSWARLAQAEAVAKKNGASRWPSLSASASGSTRQNMTTRASTESYSLGLTAAYELDLWGRVKSGKAAAAMDRDASREQLNTAAITLASQTALSWSRLVSQQLQTDLIRQQFESNKTSLELVELRFRKSQATALDVYQQRQTVANTEARIPLAELREELLRNQLAALLGRNDFQSLEILDEKLPMPGTLPAIGIPADVLANRPDVRQAGLKLRSADWSVSVARADRLPSISLSASAEVASPEFSDLFDDWYSKLIGSIAGPIFEGGRRKAEVKRTRAVVDERLAAYRETVLNAIKEVEDALVSEEKQHEYIVSLDKRLAAARRSYEEAINRYRNGVVEYTTVLIQLSSLQTLERDRIEAQSQLLEYRINLYRSLGGSWPGELTHSENEEI